MFGYRLTRRNSMILIFLITWCTPALSHEGKHEKLKGQAAKIDQALSAIGGKYRRDVQPIFDGKCMDCHGNTVKLPWYYSIPGAKQLMDSDMTEAKMHLDMSNGFPFKSMGNPKQDLEEMLAMIKEDTMPPLLYRLMHWNNQLTQEDNAKISAWAKDGIEILNGL